MQLDTSRFFSDRLVVGEDGTLQSLHADRSFWSWFCRVIAWIFSPASYTEENKKAIACVQKYLIDQLGAERLQRICLCTEINLNKKEDALLSRELAHIVVESRDVKIPDIEEFIANPPEWAPAELKAKVAQVRNAEELDSETFEEIRHLLASRLDAFDVPEIVKEMHGMAPTEELAKWFFDRMLATRERLELCKENRHDRMERFIYHFAMTIIGREMDEGMVIPAPNHPDGRPRSFRVEAKIVTGEGMVSYVLGPATKDANLPKIRFYRGTAPRSSALDSSSTVINDMDKKIGYTAYVSGLPYISFLKRELGEIEVGVGFSLGGTQLQRDLLPMGYRSAYILNSPGIGEDEVLAFNEQVKHDLDLYIREAHTDYLGESGEVVAGWRAPKNVKVHREKHHHKKGITGSWAHTTVAGRRGRIYGIEGHYEPHLNENLHHKNLEEKKLREHWLLGRISCIIPTMETIRQTIGPIISFVIRLIRDFFRWLVTSRTYQQLGIHIGKYDESGRWVQKHLRPEQIRSELIQPSADAVGA